MRRPPFKSASHSRYGRRQRKPGEMTKAEQKYADTLQLRKLAGEIVEWHYEAVTLKLADNCRYTPDFSVLLNDGTKEFVDVKGTGPVDDKSIVKIKVAAEKFFEYRFVMERERTKKNGGGFVRTEY